MRKTKYMAFIISTLEQHSKMSTYSMPHPYNINGFQSDMNTGNQVGMVNMIMKILVITNISQYIRHREMGWMAGVQYSP